MYGALNGAYDPSTTRALIRVGRSDRLTSISPDASGPRGPTLAAAADSTIATTKNVAATAAVRPPRCGRGHRRLPSARRARPATTPYHMTWKYSRGCQENPGGSLPTSG